MSDKPPLTSSLDSEIPERGDLDTVRAELSRLRMRELELESVNYHNKAIPMLQKMIGATFVYRKNNSGRGEYWDTFRRFLDAAIGKYNAWLVFEECQWTAEGKAELRTRIELMSRDGKLNMLQGGWVPCSVAEYEQARAQALEGLTNPAACVAYLLRSNNYGSDEEPGRVLSAIPVSTRTSHPDRQPTSIQQKEEIK